MELRIRRHRDRAPSPDTVYGNVNRGGSRWTPDAIALAIGYAASVVIVVATFTRSFAATADYAVAVGAARPGPDAWLVPLGIDVSIVAGSVLAYVSARAGARNRWAYGLFLFAAVVSVALNVAHAPLPLADVETAAGREGTTVAAAKIIAALPPLLLLWITEVLLRHANPGVEDQVDDALPAPPAGQVDALELAPATHALPPPSAAPTQTAPDALSVPETAGPAELWPYVVRIVTAAQEAAEGALTQREVARRLDVGRGRVVRCISEHRDEWNRLCSGELAEVRELHRVSAG